MNVKRISVSTIKSTGIPVKGNDIDTDRVIPARFMKSITFEGLGKYAFYDVRFDAQGKEKEHPFNSPDFKGASIMVVNKNFGCGSSREHAPQALQKFGITAIIGESFAEIFAGNCTAMGIPAVKAEEKDIIALQEQLSSAPKTVISIDLEKSRVTAGSLEFPVSMPEAYRKSLIQGTWDSTGVLLENIQAIKDCTKRLPYVSGW